MSAIDGDCFPTFEALSLSSSSNSSSREDLAESPWRNEVQTPEPFDFEGDSEKKAPEGAVVLLSNKGVFPYLKKKLDKHRIAADLSISQLNVVRESVLVQQMGWIRDSHVVRPDGSFLLPAEFQAKNPWQADFFYSLLPKEMLHFFSEKRGFLGLGSTPPYKKNAIELAEKWEVPYQQALTNIEGGNCHIFTAEDGKPKAIVGYNSVLMSLVRLIAAEYFGTLSDLVENSDRLKNYGEDPNRVPLDDDALRIGKNVYCFLQNEPFSRTQFPSEPIDQNWVSMARNIQNMIFLTKERMASELQIPLERVAFVFQERFHIDMELFPGSRDIVFLHDESLTKKLIEELNPSSIKFPFLKRALNYSNEHQSINEKIIQYNISVLEKIGCKAVRVPGVLAAKFDEGETLCYSKFLHIWTKNKGNTSSCDFDSEPPLDRPEFPNMLNFMNGIYFDEPSPLFITNGVRKGDPVTDHFIKAFIEAIHKVCPDLKICFIRDQIAKNLITYDGGLHCMTSVF